MLYHLSKGVSLQLVHPHRPVAGAHLDLHVTELADHAEAASLLPEAADGLVAHGRLTVSERAAVSLRRSTTDPR